jgi:hypothetical protein
MSCYWLIIGMFLKKSSMALRQCSGKLLEKLYWKHSMALRFGVSLYKR